MRNVGKPLAYAELVTTKGDARPEPQSSSTRVGLRALSQSYAGLGFAGFVLFHFSCQTIRARTSTAVPEAGFELQPLSVALLLLLWVPFLVFAWRELRYGRAAAGDPQRSERERALWLLERLSLVVVLLFATGHVTQVAVPILRGALAPPDVHPELVATLSSTQSGVPLLGVGYLCGVGGAAFYATRQALAACRQRPKAWARGVVALGVVAYLLGSYAVLRSATGELLP